MTSIEEFVNLLNADSEETWRNRLFLLARSNGFDQMLFAIVRNRHVGIDSAFLRSNYPSCWRKAYDDRELFRIDPTVAHCFASTLPLIWTGDTFATSRQRHLYEEAASYGIKAGITLPIHGVHGEVGMLTLVADFGSETEFHKKIAHSLPHLALIRDFAVESSRQFAGTLNRKRQLTCLTARELECLKWAMIGKTSWETAQILRISEATVNFHIANVRQKLNVVTRRQAVVKAIRLGLLTPE